MQHNSLNFNLLFSSSEDPSHPLYELRQPNSLIGWQSSRYCQYPQTIIIQFVQPVCLKQIHILIHEKNIPSKINFYVYNPKNSSEYPKNYKRLKYEYAGYISLDSNTRTNYKARELRRVTVDFNCLFVKLELFRNYINRYNVFNQVGIMSLEFFGEYRPLLGNNKQINDCFLQDTVLPEEPTEEELNEICGESVEILTQKMKENIELENYEVCANIKNHIEKIKLYARKVFELENKKKHAINNLDFETAQTMKNLIEIAKNNLIGIERECLGLKPLINNINNNNSNNKNDNNENENNNNNNENNNEEKKEEEDLFITDPKNSLSFDAIRQENMDNSNDDLNNYHKGNLSTLEEQQQHHRSFSLEHDFISYEDMVIPAVMNKMVASRSNKNLLEKKSYTYNEPEDLEENVKSEYELLIKELDEGTVKKIFSKQILWKEDGLSYLITKIPEMLSKKDLKALNELILLLMKLSTNLLEEKHPFVVIKSINIFKLVLGCIKDLNKLNIDISITDTMLTKIKQKLGDVNQKVRSKAVELYSYMLTLNFCDYNNLISELVEEELKHLDCNYVQRSFKVILCKLQIFDSVFNMFDDSVQNKRTSMDVFPVNLVSAYLVMNISHSKSEVRKHARAALKKFIAIFGTKKVIKKLESIEQRELIKLCNEIPELKESLQKFLPEQNNKNKSPSRRKCNLCLKELNNEQLEDHYASDCVMFINCEKCSMNIEVKKLTQHRLNECKYRNEYSKCKICQEAILKNNFNDHSKGNNCNPAKNINSSNRCPLCHKDIGVGDKGFYMHLVKEGCDSHSRK